MAGTAVVAYYGRDFLNEYPWVVSRSFDGASQVVTGGDGTVVVTDSGKTRVSVLSGYEIIATIYGMKQAEGFFYAERTAVGGGKVYIADVKYAEGSTRVAAERILQFSMDGEFERFVFERLYEGDEMPLQYGNIMDMRFYGGRLTFMIKDGEYLRLYEIKGERADTLRRISIRSTPYLCNAVYDPDRDTAYAVSKDGLLYKSGIARFEPMSDFRGDTGGEASDGTAPGIGDGIDYGIGDAASDANGDGTGDAVRSISDMGIIPWGIAVGGDGTLYIADLASGNIIYHDGSVFYSTESIVYRVDASENGIVSFTDGETIFQLRVDGGVLFAGNNLKLAYSAAQLLWRLLVWLCAAVAALIALTLAVSLIVWFFKRKRKPQTKYMMVVTASMALTAVIVAVGMLGPSLDNGARQSEYTITQMALSISNLSHAVIGDDLEAITTLGDYGGPAFTRLHEALDPVCVAAYERGEYLYFILYKVIDGMLVGVMDYEDTVGVVYPLGECPEEYLELMDGIVPWLYERDSDAYGSWMYAVAPIYNSSQEIVGIVEMGSNADVEDLRTQRQIQGVVLSTAVLLVMFLLVYTAAGALAEAFTIKPLERGMNIPEFIRPLTFLAFFADNTYTSFMPQLSARLFESSGFAFAPTLGAALPLSAHLLFVAMSAVACGGLIDWFGMKPILTIGIVVEMAGLIVTSVAVGSDSYVMLLIGMAVAGCGVGTVVVSGNTLSAGYDDEEKKNALFSGVNVGLVSGIVVGTLVGSYFVEAMGYETTLALSAVILIPALWFAFKCASKGIMASLDLRLDTASEKGTSVFKFLGSRSVFPFFLFAMFPFLTLMYFKDFVFPLFASEQGYSEVSIGQTLLFSGAIAIIVAPTVADALLKRIGAKAVNVVAGALYAGALLYFAFFPTLQSAIIAVYVFNAIGCVGLVAQGVYISSTNAAKAYGMGKSMSVFSLFDSLSQTAGPVLFGVALILGYSMAGMIMGGATVALIVLFVLTAKRDRAKREKEEG
jgi:MFS family permease